METSGVVRPQQGRRELRSAEPFSFRRAFRRTDCFERDAAISLAGWPHFAPVRGLFSGNHVHSGSPTPYSSPVTGMRTKRMRGTRKDAVRLDQAERRIIEERLRALGYI
jgi:hypothetical protein